METSPRPSACGPSDVRRATPFQSRGTGGQALAVSSIEARYLFRTPAVPQFNHHWQSVITIELTDSVVHIRCGNRLNPPGCRRFCPQSRPVPAGSDSQRPSTQNARLHATRLSRRGGHKRVSRAEWSGPGDCRQQHAPNFGAGATGLLTQAPKPRPVDHANTA